MDEKMTFEKAMEELEQITRRLETGDATLEESIQLFERGVALTGFCTKALDTAQQKIALLVRDEQGVLQERPIDGVNGDGQ